MDVTLTLMDALEESTGVPCFPTVPADRPSTFITIELTGGSDGLVLSHPNVAVQSWAPTQREAARLAEDVRQAMRALPYGNHGITHVDGSVPYHFPSVEKIPRYQALYGLTVHN